MENVYNLKKLCVCLRMPTEMYLLRVDVAAIAASAKEFSAVLNQPRYENGRQQLLHSSSLTQQGNFKDLHIAVIWL